MRTLMVILAAFCFTPNLVVYSQNPLPPGQQQQPQQQGRQVQGQAARAFGNNPGNTAAAAPGASDPAFQQQVSYVLGRNFAKNLRANEIEVDFNALMAGISDTLQNAQPKWSDQQLAEVVERFGKEMEQKAMRRIQTQAAKNQQEASTFLAQNGRQPGVQATQSGLQYQVLQQGNGASPTLNDMVRCHYRGTLLNGTEFDSSIRSGKPAEFAVNRVIPGWTEALQKMKVGDKWRLFIPPKLAYDMEPPPGAPIEPGHMLVFDIELLEVVKK